VAQALLEQADDVLVVEGVEDQASGPARPHDAHAAQQAQLVRHGRLGLAHERRQVADAQFGLRERVEQPHAGEIAEHLEGVGQRCARLLVEQVTAHAGDLGRCVVEGLARGVGVAGARGWRDRAGHLVDHGIIEQLLICSF
jgi:hypothetical protein